MDNRINRKFSNGRNKPNIEGNKIARNQNCGLRKLFLDSSTDWIGPRRPMELSANSSKSIFVCPLLLSAEKCFASCKSRLACTHKIRTSVPNVKSNVNYAISSNFVDQRNLELKLQKSKTSTFKAVEGLR